MLKAITSMKINYKKFIEDYFTITTTGGEIVPFIFNDIQNYYYSLLLEDYGAELKGIRENILKSRRFGFSSIIDAMFVTDFILSEINEIPLTNSDVYSYKAKDTEVLFTRVNQFIDSWLLKDQGGDYREPSHRLELPKLRKGFLKSDVRGNAIIGKNGAEYHCLTAGAKISGRGGTKQNIHWCVGKDTKILTLDGATKTIEDITVGDEVISEDGSTTKVINKWDTGIKPMIRIKLSLSNEFIDVSPDHKIRVAGIGYNGKLCDPVWKKAGQLTPNDYVLWAFQKTGAYVKFQTIKKIKNAVHLPITETVKVANVKTSNFVVKTDYKLGYMIGYYLAEGHITKNLNKLSFTCHPNEVYYKKFTSILPITPSVKVVADEYGTRKIVTYSSKELATFINEMVGRVGDKNLPYRMLYNYPKQYLQGVYDGWKDGDGSKTIYQQEVTSITTVHERIARPMRQLATMLNRSVPSLDLRTDRYRGEVKTKDVYVLREHGNTCLKKNGTKSNAGKKQRYVTTRGMKGTYGYTYIKVDKLDRVDAQQTFEIEVAHESHSYLTVCGVISNSEVAFYNNTEILNAKDLVTGAEEQVSSGIGKIFRETTGNVADDFFSSEYQLGKEEHSDFKSRFLAWHLFSAYQEEAPNDWRLPEYYYGITKSHNVNRNQSYWHFKKTRGLADKKRMREYPTTDTEAFLLGGDPFFDADALIHYSNNVRKPISKAAFVGALRYV